MRFGQRSTPPPFLNRRDQKRMIGMILLLGMVVLAIRMTAQPKFWWWMFPDQQQPEINQPSDQPAAAIDHSVPEQRRLRRDEFIAGPSQPDDPSATDVASTGDQQTPPPGDGSTSAAQSPSGQTTGNVDDEAQSTDWGEAPDLTSAGIPSGRLGKVKDRSVGLRPQEAADYYYLLAKSARIDQQLLTDAALPAASYETLMTDPAEFRGQVVRLKGVARRIESVPAASNPFGVETIHDLWIFTRLSGDSPIHVQCTTLPEGIPRGRSLARDVPVEVTGYFFRIEGYESVGGVHTAPLILAGQPRWLRPQPSPVRQEDVRPYVLGFVGLIAGGVVLLIWRFRASDRRLATSPIQPFLESPEKVSGLEDFETVDPAEQFASLAAELDRTSDSGRNSTTSEMAVEESSSVHDDRETEQDRTAD